ncbi:hypothetical protein BSKO_12521 [Bryopsis sp. KO-2023]|nr:hypothetical protein BSKO_09283 [Bryopsis sp. KO-2023]GMH44569.1 hypothetical protein BSKO_12521 [Bryopsis sp. KO-2023]
MHDKPSRMGEKGVIRGVVVWKHARAFFCSEAEANVDGGSSEALIKHISSADENMARSNDMEAKGIKLYSDKSGLNGIESKLWQDDGIVLRWGNSPVGRARFTMELKSIGSMVNKLSAP